MSGPSVIPACSRCSGSGRSRPSSQLALAAGAPEAQPFLARRPLLAPLDRGPAAPAAAPGPAVDVAVPARGGVAGRGVARPCLVGLEQPLPEGDQRVQVLDLAYR